MQIVINIPKDFEEHFNRDRFEDSLERIKFNIFDGISADSFYLCGNYEVETMDMLIKVLKESTPLPKGHGRLIDVRKIIVKPEYMQDVMGTVMIRCEDLARILADAPTTLEADKEIQNDE